MAKRLWKGLLIVSASFFVYLADAAAQKPWTFLVYMAAVEDDLNFSALRDLKKMMQVGSHANVHVIVYCTVREHEQQKVTKKLYIEKGSITQIGSSMARDSGDVIALEEALQWACMDYPADHMAVILWGHGSGVLNRGVCYDSDSGNYLTERDCLQAFSWGCDTLRGGKKFDLIVFDASFLASLEIAYTLSSCADYLVAAEEVIGNGYGYAYILEQLATKIFDPLSCAQLMVNSYNSISAKALADRADEYTGISDYTLSMTDLNAVQPFVDNCNAVAQVLTSQLINGKKRSNAKAALKKCINMNQCCCFDEDGVYIDVCQFYKNLLKNITGLQLSKSMINQFKQLLNDGLRLFKNMVKANVTSNNYNRSGGLSIYFSRYSLDPSYYGLYWTEQNPNWLNFLEAFIG